MVDKMIVSRLDTEPKEYIMKIIYQCEICGTNHTSAELAQKCEAQPYRPPLPIDTQVLYKGSVCRTGRVCLLSNHTYNYLLSYRSSDNNGVGYNRSQGFTHEKDFVVMIVELQKRQEDGAPAFTDACE